MHRAHALVVALLLLSGAASGFRSGTSTRVISGFGFSGSGFYIVYHAGVLHELMLSGLLVPGESVIAGTSGGAHIAAYVCAGMAPTAIRDAVLLAGRGCVDVGDGCLGRLHEAALHTVGRIIPDDATFEACRGRTFVQVSVAEDGEQAEQAACLNQPKTGWLLGEFESREDLVAAVAASSFIANVSAASQCTTPFRGLRVMDGGYTVELPCPPEAAARPGGCLRVAAVPKQAWPEWHGYGGPSCEPLPEDVDIFPGSSGRVLPIPHDAWLQGVIDPSVVLAHADALFELGRADALHWLNATAALREQAAGAALHWLDTTPAVREGAAGAAALVTGAAGVAAAPQAHDEL